jgi:hypothetical protein
MSAQEYIFTIRLEDGSQAEARTTDSASMAKLRKLMSDPKWARRPVRVAGAPGDVSGHLSGDTVAVSLLIDDDDVEGHTMTLRFPSAEEAKRLQQRLIVGGILAASIAVGAVGASQLAGQQTQVVPQAGPAITAPAVREYTGPVITPGAIDAQLRDSVSGSGTSSAITPAKDAKDAKDAARLSGADAADELSNESLGQRSVMPK